MFITYNDLDDMRDTRKRSQINAFVNRGRKANKIKAAQRESRSIQWQSQHPIRTLTPTNLESAALIPERRIIDIRDARIPREVILELLRRRRMSKITIQLDPAGYRKDPFASFPIPQSEQVEWATDFFTHSYSAMNASLYTDEAGNNWLMNTLFPLALQSDMLCEALVLSMARYSLPTTKDALIPGGVHFSHLRSSVLAKLHRTLSMKKEISTSDTTIHTVICLIAADFFAGNDDHAATHLKGLQTIVSLRGGLENGNFDHYTKYNLAGTHALCQFAEQRLRESSSPLVMSEPDLTYPSHPFSPQLCTEIATLPLGISDIALDGRISNQVIELLCRLSKMAQELPMTTHATTEQLYNISIDLMTYITRKNISALERNICLFCFIVVLKDLPERNESQAFYGQFLVNLRRRISKMSQSFMTLDGVGADFAIWGVAMLVIENSVERIGLDETQRTELFQDLLQRYPVAGRWNQTWKSLKRFFFFDNWKDEFHLWWTKQIDKNKG